jgi:hypothetical protein
MSTGRDYVIKGLLPEQCVAVAWGAPQSGKSFWAFDMAMHIALGFEYRGRRVRGGPVIYVAGEGQHGFGKRKQAFAQERMAGDEPADFYLIGEPLDLVGERDGLEKAIGELLQTPSLIVLDTLNRTIRGDENNPEDMRAYFNAADNLRQKFSCAVLIVHHCGHDGQKPRGHSSLIGNADNIFSVTRTGNIRTVEVEKNKDGPQGDRLSFELSEVELGEDDDGDPLTSCVVTPVDAPTTPAQNQRLTETQQALLTILQEAGPAGLTTDEWNKEAREVGVGAHRQALYTNRMKLKNKQLVHQSQDGKWHITSR